MKRYLHYDRQDACEHQYDMMMSEIQRAYPTRAEFCNIKEKLQPFKVIDFEPDIDAIAGYVQSGCGRIESRDGSKKTIELFLDAEWQDDDWYFGVFSVSAPMDSPGVPCTID